ncbi:MAG: protein TolQ [Reyranellaceae bacterium]
MDPTVAAQTLPGSVPPVDMSIVGMFMNADWIVKIVVIMLVLASFWSWAIIFDKLIRLRSLRAKANQFEETFWSGISLEDLYDRVGARPDDPMSSVFSGAMREWRRTVSKGIALTGAARAGLQQRIEQVMGVTVSREMESLEKRMIFLASVGSTAPFIGLFGTVWGIMNSFQSIAVSKNTSLAVVAPGIAEALFATALGLVAAVPAVIAYNKLSTEIARYAQRLDGFAAEFMTILSRQLEEPR